MILDEKLRKAQQTLRELRSVAVAFSGGVDSTLVLKLAVDTLGAGNVLAVTGVSGSLAAVELADAKSLAEKIGARHLLIDTNEMEDPNYLANPVNRCFFCKSELYNQMDSILAEHGLIAAVNGTNSDDLGDFRPGLIAADQHKVRSPLAEAEITKAEVRLLSERFDLPTADKPAAPCLSSRVQYGEAITHDKLRMIEQAEVFLRELGLRECRVRHHDKLARIEVPGDKIAQLAGTEMRSRIDAAFREIGYQYVTLDLRGFRSGSMNEVIAFGKRQT